MRDRHAEIATAGLGVLVVLCQKRANVAAWLSRHPVPFPVLCDEDRSRAKRWGVYVPFSYDSIHIARPATFVIDTSGIVRYARIGKHQLDPAPLEAILGAVPR